MDKGKHDHLPAEGHCFNCEEPRHEFRNCLKLHSMRLPQVKARSIQFARMERLAHEKETADAYVGRIQVLLLEDEDSELTYEDAQKLEEYMHGLCKIVWGKDPLWHDEETHWLADYSVQVNDDEVTVWNHVSEGEKVFDFPRQKLKDLGFDISSLSRQSQGNR